MLGLGRSLAKYRIPCLTTKSRIKPLLTPSRYYQIIIFSKKIKAPENKKPAAQNAADLPAKLVNSIFYQLSRKARKHSRL